MITFLWDLKFSGEAYLVISRAEMRDAMNIMRDYDCEPKIDSMNYARVFLEVKFDFFNFSRSLCNFIMTLDVSSTFRHILIAKYNITFWPNSVFLKTLKFRYFNSLLREFLGNSHKSGVEFGIATGTLGTGIIIFFLWFILFYFSEILRFFCVAYRLGRDAQERLDDRVRKDQFGWLFFFIF